MSKKVLTAEEKNAVTWLQKQPGVTSVVVGRQTGTRHRYKPGSARVIEADAKGVYIRFYKPKSARELFVHAPAGVERDRWIAAMGNGGQPISVRQPDKVLELRHDIKPAASFPAHVPAPKPADNNAGKLYDVTPDMAAKWLERNTRNRKLRQDVVFRYAADMKEGRWMVTGDAIAFDVNGAVVNGQHRLWAVLEADVTVPMLVVFGLDPDVVHVLDDHLKRKITDVINISHPGIAVQTYHVATAKLMMVNVWTGDRSRVLSRTSRQAQMDFLERHLPAIDFAVRECFKSTMTRGLTPAAVFAPVARASYTQDKERLKEFGRVLLSGMPESHADHAAILLRNWLLKVNAQPGVRPSRDGVYRKAERALQAFLAGERLQRNLTEAGEELFPLPEETAPGRPSRRKAPAAG